MSFKSVFTIETHEQLTPKQIARITAKMNNINIQQDTHIFFDDPFVCSCTNQRGDLPVMTYNAFPSGKIALAGSDLQSNTGTVWHPVSS